MVATRGRVPARSEERRRTNAPEGPFTKVEEAEAVAVGIDTDPDIPAAGEHWEDAVVAFYDALRVSPGVIFMYAADWHMAWALCEQWDQNLKPQFVGMEIDADGSSRARMEIVPMKGATLTALLQGFRAMGVSEEARRRMGYEAPALKHAAARSAVPADTGEVVQTRDELAAERAKRRLG